MAVFRINKTKNYTVMSNYHLRDNNLSLKTKGMLSLMLSLPDNWIYSINGLIAICKEGKKAIQTSIKELEDNNYLVRKKIQDDKGRINYRYDIFETPQHRFGCTDIGCTKKELLINTNIENTDNKDKIDKENIKHNRLTLELVNNNFININDVDIFCYDDLFNNLLEEYSYKDIILVLHYTLKHIKDNNYKDEYGKNISNIYGYLKEALYSNLEKITKEINLGY
ncbi:MAG: hypothetical protein IJ094_06150 [Bacilli bacterium]|nr:hypothetical protein [Bacilli bacterium]